MISCCRTVAETGRLSWGERDPGARLSQPPLARARTCTHTHTHTLSLSHTHIHSVHKVTHAHSLLTATYIHSTKSPPRHTHAHTYPLSHIHSAYILQSLTQKHTHTTHDMMYTHKHTFSLTAIYIHSTKSHTHDTRYDVHTRTHTHMASLLTATNSHTVHKVSPPRHTHPHITQFRAPSTPALLSLTWYPPSTPALPRPLPSPCSSPLGSSWCLSQGPPTHPRAQALDPPLQALLCCLRPVGLGQALPWALGGGPAASSPGYHEALESGCGCSGQGRACFSGFLPAVGHRPAPLGSGDLLRATLLPCIV